MTDSPQRTVLCFGDSNTHGTIPMTHRDDERRLGPGERWPGVLAARLGSAWRVIEEGLPGRTTVHDDPVGGSTPDGRDRNGLAFLPVALASHRPLDWVVLMLGTNDLKARFAVPAADIAAAAARLVEHVRGSRVGPSGAAPAVLLVAPPPIEETGPGRYTFAGGAARSKDLARHFSAEAERQGVTYLDAGTVIRSSAVDGIHYDPEAHAALGAAIADVLRAGGAP